jgi:transposase-like protein
MIDFPIGELLDDSICTLWLERHLHVDGMTCPHCPHSEHRLFRVQGHFPAYRCQACDGYYLLLTGAVFSNTRQRPASLVLLIRGLAKGEPTARLARQLGLSRKQLHSLRQRIQANLNATAPTGVMPGTAFEADEWYQHSGKNSTPRRDPTDPRRRRANKRQGHGTYANDRPPIISIIARETGAQRFWVCDHVNQCTCYSLVAENVLGDSAILYTEAWQRDRSRHTAHATVCHGVHEWARDGDGRREVHCNTCDWATAVLCTYLHVFRGVHQQDLHLYVAACEAMASAKRVTPELIRRMSVGHPSVHIGYTSAFMFNCSTEGSGSALDMLPASGEVVCHIPELPLAPGRYAFNLYLTVGDGLVDWVQQAGYLDVAAGDYFGTGQLRTHQDGFFQTQMERQNPLLTSLDAT